MSNNSKIHEGIAKALFASAWADYQEEFETGAIGPGAEIMDIMPDHIDPAAYATAGKILAEFQDLNGGWSASHLQDSVLSKIKDPEEFGHYIGMQAMGHGVGLHDYDIDYKVPYHEFGWLELDPDNYPDLSDEHDAEEEFDSPSP